MYVDDLTRLHHMVDAIREAERFATGKTRGSLDSDRMLVLALVRCIEIVGEAAKNVTRNRQNAHPEIPWKHIVDARNELIHHYFGIDADAVWAAVTSELPDLLPALDLIVADLDG